LEKYRAAFKFTFNNSEFDQQIKMTDCPTVLVQVSMHVKFIGKGVCAGGEWCGNIVVTYHWSSFRGYATSGRPRSDAREDYSEIFDGVHLATTFVSFPFWRQEIRLARRPRFVVGPSFWKRPGRSQWVVDCF